MVKESFIELVMLELRTETEEGTAIARLPLQREAPVQRLQGRKKKKSHNVLETQRLMRFPGQ